MSPSCGSNPFLSCNPTIISAARLPAPQVPFGSTCPFDCKALSSKVCLHSQEPGYQCWRSPCPGTLWCPCTCCGLLTISAPHFQWAELDVEGWSTQAFYKPLNVFIVEKGGRFMKPLSQALARRPRHFGKLLPFEVFSFSFFSPRCFYGVFLPSEGITGKQVGFMSHYVEGSRKWAN